MSSLVPVYLGLGSNQGHRRQNLEAAITALRENGFEILRISPVVESPAMLPDDAPSSWNRPYLNLVAQVTTQFTQGDALAAVKQIESNLGRRPTKRWAPRPIDIDILIWGSQSTHTEKLTIPHPGLPHRPFVLSPLCHLSPSIKPPGCELSAFEMSQRHHVIPLWMGILNITPDSFSDGDAWKDDTALREHINALIEHNVQILDIGAESTRPRAEAVTPEIEWRRLFPVMRTLTESISDVSVRPLVSVDSRHYQTLEKALHHGTDIINDVTGLRDPNIVALAKSSKCQVVAMHSLTVPVDPKQLLPTDQSAIIQLRDWLDKKIDGWLDAGLDLDKIIFDPGIGFGKTPLQSIELMQRVDELRSAGLRILIGHSRKSFMSGFTDYPPGERDLETLGLSLTLCQRGVDIIRVHDPISHIRAYRAWSQVMAR